MIIIFLILGVGAWGQESPQQPRVPVTLDCQDRTGQERFPGSFRVPCVPGPAVSEVFGSQSPAFGNLCVMGAATWRNFPVPSETSVTPRSFAQPWGWSLSVLELMHFRIWLSFFCHREARLFFLVSFYAQIRQAGMLFPTLCLWEEDLVFHGCRHLCSV